MICFQTSNSCPLCRARFNVVQAPNWKFNVPKKFSEQKEAQQTSEDEKQVELSEQSDDEPSEDESLEDEKSEDQHEESERETSSTSISTSLMVLPTCYVCWRDVDANGM